jgi:7-cyano-7-deazaguanine synthase
MKKTVVPFRNGIMLSIAAGLAESIGADMIALGNHAGDHTIYPDCRDSFIGPMKEAIFNGTWAQIELYSPFLKIDKTAIAKIGHLLKVPFEHTYTCYKGGLKHCGKCGSCTERKESFSLGGVQDLTEYEV